MTRVVIGLPIPARLTAAYGYFGTAQALGYDRAEGLDFALVYPDDPGTAARALCEGRCDVAPLNTTVGLLGSGALKHRLDPAVYYTNAHVDRFNAFDEGAVVEAAQTRNFAS